MKRIIIKPGTLSSESVLHVRGQLKVGERILIRRRDEWDNIAAQITDIRDCNGLSLICVDLTRICDEERRTK